jgi:multimeric flavodoxin WrbA
MRAVCLNGTLKRSPEESSTESLADVVMAALREHGVQTDSIRLADHRIEPGTVSEAIADGDEWPALRERILAAEILVVGTPIWFGQPSSVVKCALERMSGLLSETYDDGATPIAFNRVAGVVVVGNVDGAHHCISEISGALANIGYTIPGQASTYWVKGPGPTDELWLTTEDRDWTIATGRTAASNLLATARALRAHPIPAPPQS